MPTLLSHAYAFSLFHLNERYAQRSGEPYGRHILQGLSILNLLNASDLTKAAFALHPFYQMPEEWRLHGKALVESFPYEVHALGFHYAETANACLPRTGTSPTLSAREEVNTMLIADKVQNYSAFKRTLDGKHPDTEELHRYFQAWLEALLPNGNAACLMSALAPSWGEPMDVPLESSPEGVFGAEREHDVHTGLDLYAQVGTEVYAMRDGSVVWKGQFTGPEVGSSWWLPTKALVINHSGVFVLYGEIAPTTVMVPGQWVRKGQCIGTVAQVLRNDKGRPTSMLHLEVTDELITDANGVAGAQWNLGDPKPQGLYNPRGIVSYSLPMYAKEIV